MDHQFFSRHLLGKEEHEAIFHPKDPEQLVEERKGGLGIAIVPDCPYDQETINKFESLVQVLDNGCWGWKGGKDRLGAGRFCVKQHERTTAARASFRIYREDVGPHRREIWIVRSSHCPTIGCCYPFHLEKSDHPLTPEERERLGMVPGGGNPQLGQTFGIGTRFQKGCERLKGVDAKNAKLNERQVLEIRVKRLGQEVPFRELAEEYGVSPRLIQKITKAQAWTHLPTSLDDCLEALARESMNSPLSKESQ